MALPRIDDSARRRRLGVRHGLAAPANDVTSAARHLVGLHSSDPASVYLSAWARVPGLVPDDVGRAIYDDRSLVRVLGMRRTMFVLPVDLAKVVHAAVTAHLAPRERRRTVEMLRGEGVDDADALFERVCRDTLATLEVLGEATAVELRDHIEELRQSIRVGVGTKWEGAVGLSTRTLFLLATEGAIIRARPRGSWISSQYRWAPTSSWLGEQLTDFDHDRAPGELVRAWLTSYGPATLADLRWWTGWTVAKSRAAIASAGAVEVGLESGQGYAVADDLDESREQAPWVALLPSLDSTSMGWKERAWYLGGHGGRLFDRNGNAGPTIWSDGRVVGGWAQLRNGRVVCKLLEDIGEEAEAAVGSRAESLQAWLGDIRVKPRFRTPLEKELSAS